MTELSIHSLPSLEVSSPRPRAAALVGGPIALVMAPLALGLALQVNYGQYDPLALRWLMISLLACFAAFRGLARDNREPTARSNTRVLVIAMAAALAVQFFLLITTSPMARLPLGTPLSGFQVGVGCAAGCAALALIGGSFKRAALFGLLATHFILGLWVLRVIPPPPVDVCVFQRDACQALLSGRNPYAITFPVPYDDPARVYAPGTFAGGRLLFGYPYPPLSLLLVLPGYLLGDFRYAHLLATTLAGAFIALARPGRIATAAAALFLFTPRGFFVLEAGWTEPLAVLLLSMVVFAYCRGWRTWPILFGLLLVTKQYLILALPVVWLLKHRSAGNARPTWLPTKQTVVVWLAAVLLPVLLSAPLILWNLPAFMRSAVVLQFHQPMRMDALSFAPLFVTQTGWHLPMWLPFLAAAGACAFVLRQRTRTSAAFAAGIALVFLPFFALNKQAFCNYYFFVIGAMCCCLGAMGSNAKSDSHPPQDPKVMGNE